MSSSSTFAEAASEHQAFLVELGRLTLAWSDVEVVLFKLLKHYAGVSWPVAQALFSGTRARNAINFIRAIAANTELEPSRKEDLEETFTQVLAINSLRDFVVHNVDGSEQSFEEADPSTRYVTDALRSSRKSKSKTYLVGSATIAAMREDCVECCWRLHPHLDVQNDPFIAGSGRGKPQAWKFKPPSPAQYPARSW
ncbi:hypothetical protein ACVNIS_06470 [Sphaerotilaceae bacterium SBD11-9]